MYIDKDEIMDRQDRVLACKIFVHNLSIMVVLVSLSVCFYNYARPGSLSNWMVVFKVARGASYEIQSVLEAIFAAAHQDPIFLSSQ